MKNNKKKKAFTLVELLAVIVILAIILVIAIPQIMKVIKASKLNAIKSTAKIILRKGEEELVENEVLGTSETLICNELAKMNSDYGSCIISYDENDKLNIRLKGKENGKFDGIICSGTKDNLECTEDEPTGAMFLTGKEVNAKIKKLVGNTIDTSSCSDVYSWFGYDSVEDCIAGYGANIDICNESWFLEENGYDSIDSCITGQIEDASNDFENVVNKSITAIRMSNIKPIESNQEEKNIVSTKDSLYDIYVWYEDGTIYWWSEDKYPYLNEDSSSMFAELENLVDITGLTNFDTSKVIYINSMFRKDNSIQTIDELKNWDVSNVTDMGSSFFGCHSIRSIEALRNWNTSNLTNMHGMFGCESLESLEPLKNWDVSNVTDMSSLIYGALNLTSLNGLENWDVRKVEDLSFAFAGVGGYDYNDGKRSKLVDISALRNWNTENLIYMDDLFYNSTALTNTNGLENWNVSKIDDMVAVFSGCESLTNIEGLKNWDVSNVEEMQGIFSRAPIKDLEPLSNWNVTKVRTMNNMFSDNKTLVTLKGIENWNTSSVIRVDGMFSNCTSLKEADISNWNLSKLFSTNNANMFYDAYNRVFNVPLLQKLKTPKAYPTKSGVKINLPVTLKDSNGKSYRSLSTGSPTQTWLTK